LPRGLPGVLLECPPGPGPGDCLPQGSWLATLRTVPLGAALGRKIAVQPVGGIALACLLAATAAGCKKQNAYAPPPPPQVGVAKPEQRQVTPYIEATGTTVAYNSVDLMARIEGFVEAIQYKDGTRVKKDDPLFVIEPSPYQAKLQQAQSAVTSAQAQVTQ